QPQQLRDIVSALFPQEREGFVPPAMGGPSDTVDGQAPAEVPRITEAELRVAVVKMTAKDTAPGPDGVHGRVLALALGALGDRLLELYNGCVESGRFPSLWRTGRLVLLRKEGRPVDTAAGYRPIVLLDEAGKLLERILAARIVRHLVGVGPDLSAEQYGFREGRSTVDAILRVRSLSDEAVSRGGVALAVSLDIANAFNTLPWTVIGGALERHGVPLYLRRLVGSYLGARSVVCTGYGGTLHRFPVVRGVPQGSVLGPLLWNIGYDWVLRGALLPGLRVICYADDTLVVARGDDYRESARLATAGVALVVGRIRRLGLDVALSKSEALWFHGPRRAPPVDTHIVVGGVRIGVGVQLKYLGLVLDSRWAFRAHFAELVPRLMGTAGSLSRLLPNIGGPDQVVRRLYAGVVRSMALYGAPVWAEPRNRATMARFLRRPQRTVAIRVIRGYRTVSFEAACVLAGTPPWELEAESLAADYRWRSELRARGVARVPESELRARKAHSRRSVLESWSRRLANPTWGLRTVEAVYPVFDDWVNRG
ncbi:reverse transcriptase family protein, partial [Acinetobacter baumannii]